MTTPTSFGINQIDPSNISQNVVNQPITIPDVSPIEKPYSGMTEPERRENIIGESLGVGPNISPNLYNQSAKKLQLNVNPSNEQTISTSTYRSESSSTTFSDTLPLKTDYQVLNDIRTSRNKIVPINRGAVFQPYNRKSIIKSQSIERQPSSSKIRPPPRIRQSTGVQIPPRIQPSPGTVPVSPTDALAHRKDPSEFGIPERMRPVKSGVLAPPRWESSSNLSGRNQSTSSEPGLNLKIQNPPPVTFPTSPRSPSAPRSNFSLKITPSPTAIRSSSVEAFRSRMQTPPEFSTKNKNLRSTIQE